MNLKNKFHKMFLYKEDEIINLNNKNLLNICMSLDNNIVYPTLVSMTSALENNSNKKNILSYNMLLSDDFNKDNIQIFESLKKKYPVKINYYIIPNIFDTFKKWSKGTHCHYHKIIIPMLFPHLERILYLDSDTLIFKDISKMYNLDFNHNFILGAQAHDKYIMKRFNLKLKALVNSGVILFNIKKIRKYNKDIELLYFTMKNSKKLKYPEQDSMNIVFNKNIGILPYEYGMRIIDSLQTYKEKCEHKYLIKYSISEIKNAILRPAIVHLVYCSPKIWNRETKNLFGKDKICIKYQKHFYYYAKKTKYYSEIYNKYYKNTKL
jgi:lipopolysaccharide biosynthesis glycosyltransferase